ncbi:acyl-CoA dehydrogenase [Sphingobium sp. SCG-1]|uniref:acyl-CoA dehydrogenase family protein n=1 Tax=Sphingobium sp. SCG-1 TaxID=2072936 RepID=UPI000CD6AD3E|nr:acyl-CoA dehydrogenase family protein [Sphingobium sp. SCG-1]AUW57120.1 acyl-CoA dehydrogenase [Sphingobium sp. SCG-1]
MKIEFSAEERLFRERVRDWLVDHKPKAPRPPRGRAIRDFDLAWQKAKYEGGFGAVTWPKDYGGAGLSAVEQLIYFEELAKAGAPGVNSLSPALNHAAPTIIAAGSDEQKSFHLPQILKGDVLWCQGFSEPGAGSDLGGIRMRAEIDGDHLVLNGQKIWTSFGQFADWQETLVRTESGIGKHKGISWLIVDMKTPGIDVRPLDTIANDQHFCGVFYDNVRVPLTNVVGGLGNGWQMGMVTLNNERIAAAASHSADLVNTVENLIELARTRTGPDGRPMIADEELAARLARHRAEASALCAMTYATISKQNRGNQPGPEGALPYLYFGELLQRVRLTGLDVLGGDILALDSLLEKWTRGFLTDRMYVIAGGSAEVRRNIIAKTMLGLPRSY